MLIPALCSEDASAPATTLFEGAAYVRVLDVDPELAAGVPVDQLQHAANAARAPALHHSRGPWCCSPPPDPAALGMLIVDGLIVLQVGAGDRANLELLGAGDVIGPWVGSGPEMPFTASVTTRVIADARLALLDRRFARRTAAWPEIHAALTQRLILRARRLGLQSAVNSIPRVEDRLELTLWILGCRFGRVSARGLKLGLRLTHAQLAAMVGAQRPSVTVALRQLEQDGRLSRSATDWVLAGPEPALFRSLVAQSGLVDLTV